jgi:hypothetical protein
MRGVTISTYIDHVDVRFSAEIFSRNVASDNVFLVERLPSGPFLGADLAVKRSSGAKTLA